MTAWTPKEIRTLTRNMHLNARRIHSVIPTRSIDAIRKMKTRIVDIFPSYKLWRERADISGSLRARGWSGSEANLYVAACTGDENSVMKLNQLGLWNMKCGGIA